VADVEAEAEAAARRFGNEGAQRACSDALAGGSLGYPDGDLGGAAVDIKRRLLAAERFWSLNYIQHSAHIPPGREGLFALIKEAPEALHYENGLTVANGDYVLLHGRFSGLGRPANGQLAEHWDVIQDEATREQSRSGLPMFGDKFPG
jgi:predicted SnoaL-like aldol condensation-catalyzing enzyme